MVKRSKQIVPKTPKFSLEGLSTDISTLWTRVQNIELQVGQLARNQTVNTQSWKGELDLLKSEMEALATKSPQSEENQVQ